MPNPNHHVCIHGHFYQPPRENPWLGVIEPQPSAFPAHDWNERIAGECYAPLTRSRIHDRDGRLVDLYNCFAHLSFNIGPTLYAWIEKHHPELLTRIRIGDELHASARGNHPGALAQPYSHPILPLASARDRHTQIVWGLQEYVHRYGHRASGLWLPECAIDMNTIRALIDHGIRFVVLNPYQASAVRPFGRDAWQDVSQGGPDTRLPYRVFEVDGAGRTHFHRHLDVFFYDLELSLKISFEHLLSRPEAFETLLFSRFDENATLPQLVCVATDGEVYGHHEPRGEEMLARFFARIAPQHGVYVSNFEQYLAENPPAAEVRLWSGPDGRGSSWSCTHGVGRWFRDCGCHAGSPPGWDQAWRTALRQALDALRREVAAVFTRDGAQLFVDPWEARDDYIRVLLTPDEATRAAFLARHARHPLSRAEAVDAWELLEASRNAMLMYTSCGWFFSDIGGIEPVQNLRYALRAMELTQPRTSTDLLQTLCQNLEHARSNEPHKGSGADIFRREVMPTRYEAKTIAACHVLARMLGLPPPAYASTVEFLEERVEDHATEGRFRRGRVRVTDRMTLRQRTLAFCGGVIPGPVAGVLFSETEIERFLQEVRGIDSTAFGERLQREGVRLRHLPAVDRERFLTLLLREQQDILDTEVRAVYARAAPLLASLAESNVTPPPLLRTCAEHVLEERFHSLVQAIADAGRCTARDQERVRIVLEEGAAERLQISRFRAMNTLTHRLQEQIAGLAENSVPEAAEDALSLLHLGEYADIPVARAAMLQDAYWRFLHGPAQSVLAENGGTSTRELLWALGESLGFSVTLLEDRLGR